MGKIQMNVATDATAYDPVRLQYRRQFILGPQSVDFLETWKSIPLQTALFLTAHPDLHVETVRNGSVSITLLGDVLDPQNPDAGNGEIAIQLLEQLCKDRDFDSFIERTYRFAGRWAMILDNGHEIRLYHDAAGMRQVYYHIVTSGPSRGVWCASQPSLLSHALGLSEAPELAELVDSLKLRIKEYWWPGGQSRYSDIKLLLPNHFLNLGNGRSHRFWPTGPRVEKPLDEVVAAAGPLLQGIMLAASRRFPLAFPLTAGIDSRLILAASRDIKDKLLCYTLVYYDLTEQSPDIWVPSNLLKKLAIDHHVYECPKQMDPELERIYRKNVTDAHDAWSPIAQGLWNHLPPDHVCVRGTVSEIARCFFMRPRVKPEPDSGFEIARHCGLHDSEYIVSVIDEWQTVLGDTRGYHIMDLFYWEQRLGTWAATNYTEWDIAQDVFSPYNCRELLMTMLSAGETYRHGPEYTLYQELLKQLWPSVLSEPINPLPPPQEPKDPPTKSLPTPISIPKWRPLKGFVIMALKQIHLYESAKKIKRMIRG